MRGNRGKNRTMASTLDKTEQKQPSEERPLTVFVDADEYAEAVKDPKVRKTLERADAAWREFESDGRNL